VKLKSLLKYHINVAPQREPVATGPCTYCHRHAFVLENGKPYKCALCNTLLPEFQAKVGIWLW